MSVILSEPFLDLVAQRLQAIGEPNRMRLLTLLEQKEGTVQELTDEMSTTHQNVSRHLNILHAAGIVSRCKDGAKVRYALADFTACRLVEQVAASVTGYVEELASIAGVDATE